MSSTLSIISANVSRSAGRHRRERHAAVAHDDAGDAVPAARRPDGIPRELSIEVRVDVDEAGGHEPVGRIDLAAALGGDAALGRVDDLDDPISRDPDVSETAGAPVPSTTVPLRMMMSCFIPPRMNSGNFRPNCSDSTTVFDVGSTV